MKGSLIRRCVRWAVGSLVAFAAMGSMAGAQNFPMLKGDTNRTGKSSSPNTSGPGQGLLNWLHPDATDNAGTSITIDNLMLPDPATDPAYVTMVGNWFGSEGVGASPAYRPPNTNNPPTGIAYDIPVTGASGSPIVITTAAPNGVATGDLVTISGVLGNTAANGSFTATQISPTSFSLDGTTSTGIYTSGGIITSPRKEYLYAESIASATGTDPRIPLNATDTLSTFTWSIRNPVTPFYESHAYAVYVHIPSGPSTIGGVLRFPQRYYVFQINYSGGSKVEVVDTDRTGGGWVRLGNKGLATSVMFPSDSATPITVTLFNTVPRDESTGQLTENAAPPSNDLNLALPRPIVYADAVMAVPQVGSYAATPIVSQVATSSGPEIRAVAVLNRLAIGTTSGSLQTSSVGEVSSYDYNTGLLRWKFVPLQEGSFTLTLDNTSADVGPPSGAGTWTADTLAANYRGTNYYSATVTDTAPGEHVDYAPSSLNPGSYDIYAWLPGDSNGQAFAHGLQYEIHEAGVITTVTVDQSAGGGWVRIGTRRFVHDPNGAGDLFLRITNVTTDATDVTATRRAYADAVRFVGPTDLAINSTPVQATVRMRLTRNGAVEDHSVVLVADEKGKIYCLDAGGRGDGSTDVLWTYPSTRDSEVPEPTPGDPDTWQDPNLNAPSAANPDWGAIDGVNNQQIAQVPSGFGLSSAVIARVNGEDYLYIGDSSGRVFCIEMAGRGDHDTSKRKPGTTRRVWTYPSDYPAPAQTSNLGAFEGSVAFADTAAGPTVFVPTRQGRLYALDAAGNAATHTTTTRWTYPGLTSQTLGTIATTPAVDFGHVYFGTQSKDGVSSGQFLAVNQETGALVWSAASGTTAYSDFNGSPVTTASTTIAGGMPDTVFTANDNRGVYAFDATSGALLWQTYEGSAPVRSSLTYTVMNVPDAAGTLVAKPVIVAPQDNGRVSIYHAQTLDLTNTGGRLAKGYTTQSQSLTASVSVGWNYMYIADNAGYLFALSFVAGSFPPGYIPPLTEVGGGNTPGSPDYAQAKVKLMKKDAYLRLRQNTMYYAEALDPANSIIRDPMAFEWGETLYLMIYDFPYKRAGTSVPPVINVNFSVGGQTIRNVFTEARLFPGDYDASTPPPVIEPFPESDPHGGYAILSFTIQSAGANALPPGGGEISIGFNTTDTSGSPINYPSTQRQPVFIANPLGLVIPSPVGPDQAVGATNETSNLNNLINGTPSTIPLLGTFGTVTHGQNGSLGIGVIDRSLVTLIRGPGRGLQNVRLERNDLAWQPGTNVEGEGKPINPIDPILFPNYEDLPVQIPNISLDYPDIERERVTVVKSAREASENPVSYPVELLGPKAVDGSDITEANANERVPQQTVFDLTLQVPLYQPANQSKTFDANAGSEATIPSGYAGTYYVYVDTSGNGVLDRPNSFIETDSQEPSATREAFRNYQLATGVPPDIRFAVLTPTVDLGSLSETTGYTPGAPGPGNGVFDPWTGTYVDLFKPFEVANLGNVNLLNLRLAKATTTDDASFDPWKIFSNSNEDLAYLDGDFDLWSDLDPSYAPTKDISPEAPVIAQKSRVGDLTPRHVSPNPVIRFNANLGVIAEVGRLPEATYPVGPPRVAITVPFGFPVGTYSTLLRVIEDKALGSSDASMAENLDPSTFVPTEEYSDPTLRVIVKVKEARATSYFGPRTAPMLDSLFSGNENFRYANLQPSAFRHPSNGGFVMAIASNRNDWEVTSVPTQAINNAWRIFVSSVQGTDPGSAPGTSPLRDLYAFTPDLANGRWFLKSPQTAQGYPDASLDDAMFNLPATGESGVAGTVRYGSPVFSATGMLEPFRNPNAGLGAPLPNALMAFVGERQIVSADQTRRTESRIFVSPVTVDNAGAVGIGDAYAMTNDPLATKGRPSIVQTANGFYLFYAATIGGRSNIYCVMPSNDPGAQPGDGSYFSDSIAIDMGEGFESVSSPSAVGRLYRGISPTDNPRVIELVFSGKLRGRNVNEAFYGRVGLDAANVPAGLVTLPIRTREQLVAGSESGLYLADGVRWVRSTPVSLGILRNGVYTDLAAGAQDVERDSGTITFNTKLGGKAYLDPNMGTVKLTGSLPPRNATLVLTYQPRLLRISEGTSAGYGSPNLAVDDRLVPDVSYWFRGGDQSPASLADSLRSGRFLVTYGRAAAGAGQAARPVMKSLRLGVELPLPVYTDANGNIESFTVTAANPAEPGALQYYQVDPAKKRVYFTAEDEDRSVTITYTAADEATGQRIDAQVSVTARVNLIVERAEELVPMDQATNETNLSMFLDPFDSAAIRRPGLVWLLWSSTRTGSPDVYMETIAPRFTPVVAGK